MYHGKDALRVRQEQRPVPFKVPFLLFLDGLSEVESHELRFHPDEMICTSTDDDQKVPYTFDGKQIVMDTEPFRMVFER